MASSTKNISIASNALLLLGHEPITSFTEGTVGATIASSLYENSYRSLLTTYRWRFATKSAIQLARLSTSTNENYDYAFQLPADLLYLQRVTDSNLDYEIYGDTIQTNQKTLYIDYTYNIESDKLPAYYVKTLEFYLAAQFALSLTGDLNKMQAFEKMYIFQSKQAKFADGTQRPAHSFQDNPYADVRM